jgi:3-oxoadipate enol-lactonase
MKKIDMKYFVFQILICLIISSCTTNIQNTYKSGFVNIGKCKLNYEMKGEGTPLIMIHAGYLNKKMWDKQFSEFAKKFKVIMYDARMHGLSQSEPDTFSNDKDLYLLMEKLNIPKAVIMGISMGGYTAIDFTLAHPEKVIGLIPVSSGLTGYDFTDSTSLKYNSMMQKAQSYEEAVEYIQRCWTDGPYRTPDQVDSVIRNNAKRWYLATVTHLKNDVIEKRLDPPAINRLTEIKVPTMAIVGNLDIPGIIEIADMIVRDVKGAQKVTIKGAAHLVNMEKPEEFNRIVIDFINSLKIN